jgi:NAD+ diphosphatase
MRESLPYTGGALDRAPGPRADPGWVEALLASPSAVIIPMWSDKCLVGGAGAVATADMRALFPGLRADAAAELAYARGLLHWHREQRFCGACGGVAGSREGGHLRVCRDCGKLLFPRIEPAVITLATFADRCLLGRHRGAGPGAFATLAGFVEIGESLEEAVRREVGEEAGVKVGEVTYRGSQPWPFPGGVMIGFRAVALSATRFEHLTHIMTFMAVTTTITSNTNEAVFQRNAGSLISPREIVAQTTATIPKKMRSVLEPP